MEEVEVKFMLITDNEDGTYTEIEMTEEQRELLANFLYALKQIHPLMLSDRSVFVRPSIRSYTNKQIYLQKNDA